MRLYCHSTTRPKDSGATKLALGLDRSPEMAPNNLACLSEDPIETAHPTRCSSLEQISQVIVQEAS
jgi:hypothetical protein